MLKNKIEINETSPMSLSHTSSEKPTQPPWNIMSISYHFFMFELGQFIYFNRIKQPRDEIES